MATADSMRGEDRALIQSAPFGKKVMRRDLSPPIVSKARAAQMCVRGAGYEASSDCESIAIGQCACHAERKTEAMRTRIALKSPRNVE